MFKNPNINLPHLDSYTILPIIVTNVNNCLKILYSISICYILIFSIFIYKIHMEKNTF